MIRRRTFLSGSLAAAATPSLALAQAYETDPAIRDLSHYVATVLVTPSGMGRSDYDLVSGAWFDYEPHWHTGQQILALVDAWRETGDDRLLEAARRAGDWWISTEFQSPHRLAGLVNAWHGDHVGPLINFTTIADGTPGLFALTRATGDQRYADCATRSGDWLYRHTSVPDADGLFYNMINPDTGRVITDYSPHHRDVANPSITQVSRPNIEGYLFADIYRHTGDRIWRDRFLAQADSALRWQHPNGLWMDFEPNDPETGQVHPRFNVWNAEALLEAYALSNDPRFLEGALKTARFMASVQDRRGTIYYDLNADGTWTTSSITGSAVAFAGILWLRLIDFGAGEAFGDNVARAVAWCQANRLPSNHPDSNLRGAMLEMRVRFVDGRARIAFRDIASSFGLRFLCMANRRARGANVNETLS